MYDVLIAGWGPTGMTAACLLSRAGHKVAVFERHRGLYPLPRVGGVHDDILRVFQDIGIIDQVLPAAHVLTTYDMVHGDEVIFASPLSARAAHGWPQLVSVFQPYFERDLDNAARAFGADIHQGQRIVGISQAPDHVEITLEDVDSGARSTARGRYLIGCDGGNSFVREALAIESDNLGFDQDWLVVDGELKRQRESWPDLRQLCDPEQPGMAMRMGKYHRRWAFMIYPDESLADAIEPSAVWRRLDRPQGATPDEVTLIRHASYRFSAQLARQWRVGRVFLAGDAAHQMPPYLGQGMCSGIRDAQNLALKLDLVLSEHATDAFLDTYTLERSANCRTAIEESVRVGRSVIERAPDKVRARDLALKAAQAQSTQQLVGYRPPGLTEGFIARSSSNICKRAGDVFMQGRVAVNDREGLFDDLVGRGFLILARHGDPARALPEHLRAFWASLGGRFVTFGEMAAGSADIHFHDIDGWYGKLLDEAGGDVIVKRSDYHIFGIYGAVSDLPVAITDLQGQLLAQHAPALETPASRIGAA